MDMQADSLSLYSKWCRENQWIMVLSPPHTTGIHQPLDQIFKNWHKAFNDIVKRWCAENVGREVDKAKFAELLAVATLWTRPDSIVGAFRHCGVSIDGLNLMPKGRRREDTEELKYVCTVCTRVLVYCTMYTGT